MIDHGRRADGRPSGTDDYNVIADPRGERRRGRAHGRSRGRGGQRQQRDQPEVRARLSGHIPVRRHGEPGEFGRAAAFVLSPAASYITGAMIPVDGGAISSI